MQLAHIALDKLSISPLNMRHGKKPPNIASLLPSVRARGILQPLLVRPNGSESTYEIVAGRRRYFAAKAVAEERAEVPDLPCGILEDGDDADALEASLIENLHRENPDEVSEWETFTRLIKEGKTVGGIAVTFGLSERQVEQRLALGNLLPKIREAYRREDIDVESIRHLTMASRKQQTQWLKLYEEGEKGEGAPFGSDLKHWLCGGRSIATKVALFSLDDYAGHITADLFGEESYFADAETFWTHQSAAIAARKDAYVASGWREVVVLPVGERFQDWQHQKTRKKDGGKVFISTLNNGEVTFHEGYLDRKEAARRTKGDTAPDDATAARAPRPEATASLQNYIDLHRHSAVRTALLEHPTVALRLVVAHVIAGSGLWQVKPEPQRTQGEAIAASLKASPAEAAFQKRRAEVMALLELPDGAGLVAGHADVPGAILARLLAMTDARVMKVLTVAMAESLEAGSAYVEAIGNHLRVDMRTTWTADETFFGLLRDTGVINAMLKEVAGKAVANANLTASGKSQKQIIKDCLAGANGRTKVTDWLPGWMAFPVRAYRKDGGLATAAIWAEVRRWFKA